LVREANPTGDASYLADAKDAKLEKAARLDLLVDERLVVELTAVETLAPIHVAQVISYLWVC
jgi:GxxExxY protein